MQCSVHGENIVVFCMHIGFFVVSRYHASLQQTLRRYSHSHSLTLSLTPSLAHSLTHSFTHSVTLSLPHSLSHSLIHPDSQTRKLPASPAAQSECCSNTPSVQRCISLHTCWLPLHAKDETIHTERSISVTIYAQAFAV
jgi:hypothetical protein